MDHDRRGRRRRCGVCVSNHRWSIPHAWQRRGRRRCRAGGALIVDAIVGDVARVRVTVISGSSFASVFFGLAPALAAAIVAVAVLASLERVKRRSAR